jgi:hypothetical protein
MSLNVEDGETRRSGPLGIALIGKGITQSIRISLDRRAGPFDSGTN